MGENTVEVNGVQFDANDLLEAAQKVAEEPDGYGVSVVGNVIVRDDGLNDTDVKCYKNGSDKVLYRSTTEVIEIAESAIETTFEEYVKKVTEVGEEEHKVGGKVKGRFSDAFGFGYDLLLWSNYSITFDLMQELINDDGVEVGYVRPKDDGILVGLNDSR